MRLDYKKSDFEESFCAGCHSDDIKYIAPAEYRGDSWIAVCERCWEKLK